MVEYWASTSYFTRDTDNTTSIASNSMVRYFTVGFIWQNGLGERGRHQSDVKKIKAYYSIKAKSRRIIYINNLV